MGIDFDIVIVVGASKWGQVVISRSPSKKLHNERVNVKGNPCEMRFCLLKWIISEPISVGVLVAIEVRGYVRSTQLHPESHV